MEYLPIYDITLKDTDRGIYAVSLVKNPAMKSNFIHFSEEKIGVDLFMYDEEKREVIGAIIIPDTLILRKLNGQYFYIRFSKEVIRKINEKMQETGGNRVFTIQHEMDAKETVKFLESWIKETDEDKSNAFGINAPIGSLFAKIKINSDLVWENIKEGKLNGFSIELDSSIERAAFSAQNEKENMDFKSMYDNSIVVDGVELLFNGELKKSALAFTVIENDGVKRLSPYTGIFKVDNVEYEIKDALVVEVKDINLSIEEKISDVVTAISEIKALLSETKTEEDGESKEDKLDTILLKLEESKLRSAQEQKNEGEAEQEELKFSVETYGNIRDWAKKWN